MSGSVVSAEYRIIYQSIHLNRFNCWAATIGIVVIVSGIDKLKTNFGGKPSLMLLKWISAEQGLSNFGVHYWLIVLLLINCVLHYLITDVCASRVLSIVPHAAGTFRDFPLQWINMETLVSHLTQESIVVACVTLACDVLCVCLSLYVSRSSIIDPDESIENPIWMLTVCTTRCRGVILEAEFKRACCYNVTDTLYTILFV